MRTRNLWVVWGVVGAISGCGSDNQQGTEGGSTANAFQELAGYDWTVDPGVEDYYCGFQTLTEDLYINDFRPEMPPGTHHVVIGYQTPGPPDGFVHADDTTQSVCNGITFGDIFAFAATVGTQELVMPAGVAVKIPAGQQIVFGLHVINTGTSPLSGHSGVEVVSPDPSTVVNEAEVIAAMNGSFAVPPGKSTATATCTMVGDTTVFGVLPHMHLTGVHMTATAGPPPGTQTTLFNADYQFTDQRYSPIDPPLLLKEGDQMQVACDYQNNGTETLTPGESTTKNEMCITFAYRYPALSQSQPAGGGPRGYCMK